ncbi:hypothetical protein PM082_010125 [Marasmius tenuissimus]|nr:hypothetical protein PM082_010125 [Marasmius tenuissimus]
MHSAVYYLIKHPNSSLPSFSDFVFVPNFVLTAGEQGLAQHITASMPDGLISLFGPDVAINVRGTPGQGPTKDIWTALLEDLHHHPLWASPADDSPFIVPRLYDYVSAQETDPDHDRDSIFRAHGIMIAAYMFQFGVAPLPISPWIMLYLVMGPVIAYPNVIPLSLLAELDPWGWATYQYFHALRAGMALPSSQHHVGIQFLIDMLGRNPGSFEGNVLRPDRYVAFHCEAFSCTFIWTQIRQTLFDGHRDLESLRAGFCVVLNPTAEPLLHKTFDTDLEKLQEHLAQNQDQNLSIPALFLYHIELNPETERDFLQYLPMSGKKLTG